MLIVGIGERVDDPLALGEVRSAWTFPSGGPSTGPQGRASPPPRHAAAWSASTIAYLRGKSGAWLRGQGEPWAALYEAAAGRPAKPYTRRGDTIRMLTGLVRCACGGSVTYHSRATLRDGTRRRFGRCRDAQGRQGCYRRGRHMDALEAAVEAWLFALPDPRTLAALPDDDGAAALEARRRRVAELYRDDLLTPAEYERERAEFARLRSCLRATGTRREEVGAGLVRARETWPVWGEEAKRAFLAGLVEHFVAEGGTIRPVWRKTVAALWEENDGALGDPDGQGRRNWTG